MTIEEARQLKRGDYIHHVTKINADGTPMRARVLSVKTWKRDPLRIVVSVKHGLYDYASFSAFELSAIEIGYGQ
jgi:hypothetical protein